MYLPETLAARRVCMLAGQIYWVRPLSVESWATLLAWLDDFMPGRDERPCPPAMSDAETQAQIETPAGRALLTWLALEESGVSFTQAAAISDSMTDDERGRLYSVLFARRRTYQPGGVTGDISETWCGKGWAQSAVELGMVGLGKLSLDQLEWLGSEGKADEHMDPAVLGLMQAQKMFDEAVARGAQVAELTPKSKASEGPPEYVIKPDNGVAMETS